MISKSTEEYLKNIYILYKQKGEVRVTDLAEKMNCSKPSVTKQLNSLSKNNLIEHEVYGNIKLTNTGIEYAKKILADYDIVYILLHDIIGINEDSANEEASLIKKSISDDSMKKISSYIYEVLGLNKLKCNFNIRNESCRDCKIRKKEVDKKC